MNNIITLITLFTFSSGHLLSMEQLPQPPKLLQQKQIPSAKAQTYLDKLPTEIKGEILSYVKLGRGILNIPAFAQATMAMGDINDPDKLLGFLQSMPTKAASINLAEKLQTMSAMKESKVQQWLKGIKLEKGDVLFSAVYNSHSNPETVSQLLDNPNIELDWKNYFGTFCLYYASHNNYFEILRLFLTAGADVNAKDNKSVTALMMTSLRENTPIFNLLLAAGADVNAKNNKGETALMWASVMGKVIAVKILLTAGALANSKNNDGKTAGCLAREKGHIDIVNLLTLHKEIKRVGKRVKRNSIPNIPALTKAIICVGDSITPEELVTIFELLPTKAAAVHMSEKITQSVPSLRSKRVQEWFENIRLEGGQELFMAARSCWNTSPAEVAAFLGNQNVDLNWENKNGKTALIKASSHGSYSKTVKYLLVAGADVDARDYKRKNALVYASEKGHTKIVKLLLKAGAEIDAKNCWGETAYMLAHTNGHREAVELLIAAGANPDLESSFLFGQVLSTCDVRRLH